MAAQVDKVKIDKDEESKEYNCLFALAFSLIGAAELIINVATDMMRRDRMQLRHEAKQTISQFLNEKKRLQYHFDRMTELAVNNGRPMDDNTDALTAHISDNNAIARFVCMLRNATIGEKGEENGLIIESTLKTLSKGDLEISYDTIDKFYMK